MSLTGLRENESSDTERRPPFHFGRRSARGVQNHPQTSPIPVIGHFDNRAEQSLRSRRNLRIPLFSGTPVGRQARSIAAWP